MAYQVIARKYRPQRFEDVVGQGHVTRTLSHAIRKNRIAHAYLFCGPRGTGKTTLARIFAKCLNCTDGPQTDFADDDQRCIEITEGRSLDVLEIDGASNRGIEEIRELRDTVRYAPAASRYKIYIIDEVHMLTKEAFNALLKTLEEPPEHVKFMFATTEPEKVLPTILSRCQRFDLRRIPNQLIVKHLAQIAALEDVTVEESAIQAVARGADGGMRDAESVLDQLISFCGAEIMESDVLSMFGMASRDQVLQMARALVAGDTLQVLQLLDGLTREGKELGRLLSDLLGFFRSLMLYQLSQRNEGLVQVSEAELAVLQELAGQLSPERLTRVLEVLSDCDYRMKGATAKRIFFEVALIKAIEAIQSMPLNEVLETLKKLRNRSDGGAVAMPVGVASKSAPPSKPRVKGMVRTESVASVPPAESAVVASPNPVPPPVSQNAPDLRVLWPQVLSYVADKGPFTHSYLQVAQPLALEGRVLTIGFPPQAQDHITLLEGRKNRVLLNEALKAAGLKCNDIRFVIANELADRFDAMAETPEARPVPEAQSDVGGDGTEPTQASAPTVIDQELFENDPLIGEALEIFKGQIVGIDDKSS
ncbi:MAG: DNA polymerase III subunit tau [Verrucomicrobia subdivision 3 bacterium]|nr:DNA polymerase III subunit tau [Limisphaerales bacterium]MCS1414514.1 DNA polymerase III subunit tau [Limisphaerales bacterium]